MTNRLLLCLILSVTFACTKKSGSDKKVKFLPFDSPIQYVYEKIDDKEQAALVKDSPVSWAQLLSQDLALQELQGKYDKSKLVFSYAWAKALNEKSGQPVKLEFYGVEPKTSLSEILAQQNVEVSDQVEITYIGEPASEIIAQVGSETLSWEDYNFANMNHSKLYRSLFQQRMQRLNGIVIRRFLLEASKTAQLPMEEFVKKNILEQAFNPTEADVREFAKNKGIAESDLNEKLLARLTDIVKQNDRDKKIAAYVAKNLIKSPIKVAFPGAKLKISAPDLAGEVPQWGAKGPELMFIGHWSCEGCSETLKAFLKTKQKSSQVMRGAFVYSFPVRDREARMGAEAALCVDSINRDSYWIFLDKILELEESDIEKKINTAVIAAGVDADQFKDCFLKRKFQQAVDTHLSYAKSMGVTRSPLLVVQGQVLEPPFDPSEFASLLKSLNIQAKAPGLWQKIKSFFGM